MSRRSIRLRLAAILGLAVLTTAPAAIGQAVPAAPSAAAPDWLAWRVFHEALVHYTARSQVETDRMLAKRFGLGSFDAARLRAAGRGYLDEINRLDESARAEVDRRWGIDMPAGFTDRRPALPDGSAAPGSRPVLIEPGKTLLEMARESGLYDEVETQKESVLAAHLVTLTQTIGVAAQGSIDVFVRTVVSPQVKTADVGLRVVPPSRESRGSDTFRRRDPLPR